MTNYKLLQLLESILGKGKSTSGDNIAFFSPFISHYKPKLEINIKTTNSGDNPWHCWISDKKGRSIKSLFTQLNLPKEKFEQLSKIIQSSRYNTQVTPQANTIVLQLPDDYSPLWKQKKSPDYKNALHYLLNTRGISVYDILKYRIGYCENGKYSGKIIIPSYDCNSQLNYFVSRAYYKSDSQKHKNPDVSKDIIGLDMMINWSQPIILCEGVFDAIAIKRNAIPLFGKIIQPNLQRKIIEQRVKDIYICLDRDALQKAIQIAEKFMNEGLNVYFIELEDDKDASELGFEKINEIINNTSVLTFERLIQLKLGMLWI